MHDAPLIATLVSGIVLAFVFAALAHKLKLPPLAGYLMAGVVVGPFTPGYVADGHLAHQLAELGVVLLMFGVGLHFSLKDLLSVKSIAIPGALGQMGVATALGMLLGWGLTHAIVGMIRSDQFLFPVVIQPRTYAWAAICVVAAGVASALVVRRRIDRLDMVAALKTRE